MCQQGTHSHPGRRTGCARISRMVHPVCRVWSSVNAGTFLQHTTEALQNIGSTDGGRTQPQPGLEGGVGIDHCESDVLCASSIDAGQLACE